MSKRVKSVVVEDCELVVTYSDCTEDRYDLRDCGDDTPVEEVPGDSPDPFPQSDVRCRVAVHVAAGAVTDRYIDFLNAATPAAAASFGLGMAGVVTAKLAAWAWSALLYPDLWGFGMNVVFTGDRDTALTEYNGAPQTVIDTVAEALYCVLPGSGAIDETVRQAWREALIAIGGATYVRLAEFLGIYPLARLRDEAFEASITEDAVDCSAFDCGDSEGVCDGALEFNWQGGSEPFDDYGWAAVTGMSGQFPGFNTEAGIPIDRAITVNRNQRGWDSDFAPSGEATYEIVAISLSFPINPYKLCSLNVPFVAHASADPAVTTPYFGERRVGAIYAKLNGESSWVQIGNFVNRPPNNNQEMRIVWDGALLIDEIAIVAMTHERVMTIYEATMNG